MFPNEEALLNMVYELYNCNNNIIGMYHNNTCEINNIYYISIIAFIISMNREISKITIMIIIYSTCLIYFVMNNIIDFMIITTSINSTIATVKLIKIHTYIIHLSYYNTMT